MMTAYQNLVEYAVVANPFAPPIQRVATPCSMPDPVEIALSYLFEESRRNRLAQLAVPTLSIDNIKVTSPFVFSDGQKYKYRIDLPSFDALLEVQTQLRLHFIPLVINRGREGLIEDLRKVNYVRRNRLPDCDFTDSPVLFVRWSPFSKVEVDILKANNIIPVLLGEDFVNWGKKLQQEQTPAIVDTF